MTTVQKAIIAEDGDEFFFISVNGGENWYEVTRLPLAEEEAEVAERFSDESQRKRGILTISYNRRGLEIVAARPGSTLTFLTGQVAVGGGNE